MTKHIDNIKVAKHSYGILNILNEGDKHYLIIGNFCSIALKTVFIVESDHHYNYLSTFPFRFWFMGKQDAISKGDIILQDDVWIGHGAIILSGVTIHQGAVVAAGSVVVHDVSPYAIVAGVPAKVIKYRFNQDIINFLLTLDYSGLTEEMIKEHINDLYQPIESLSLDEIKELYSWFPKKKNEVEYVDLDNSSY